MSVRLAFVAMLKSGSGKLNAGLLQVFVACFSSACVCGPLALIRLNSSQLLSTRSSVLSDILYVLLEILKITSRK